MIPTVSFTHDVGRSIGLNCGPNPLMVMIHLEWLVLRLAIGCNRGAAPYRLWQVALVDERGLLKSWHTFGSNPGGLPTVGLPVPREELVELLALATNPLMVELWTHSFEACLDRLAEFVEPWLQLNPNATTMSEAEAVRAREFQAELDSLCAGLAEELNRLSTALSQPSPSPLTPS